MQLQRRNPRDLWLILMFLLGGTNGISMRLKEKTPGTIEHGELSLQMQPKQENTTTFSTFCVKENKK